MRFKPALIDFRAEATRQIYRKLEQPLSREAVGRMALHMSNEEQEDLIANNPYTLGHPESAMAKCYWRIFVESSDSDPYKIRRKV